MKITVYQEYDGAIFGDQKYLCLLLEEFKKYAPEHIYFRAIVPTKKELYKEAITIGEVELLNEPHWIFRVISLIKVIKRSNTDVILCTNERSMLTILLASLLKRIPIVSYVTYERNSLWSDFICFFFAKRVLGISPQSILIKNGLLRKLFHKKIFMLLIGARLEKFFEVPLANDHNGPMKILLVASITYRKGIDIALDAMEELNKRKVSCVLRIAGAAVPKSEVYADSMRDRSKRFKYVQIEWLGWKSNIPELLSWADVLILPTRSEALGVCLIEAMAAGRPVITTPVGGIPSIVKDGLTGFLISPNDPSALANYLSLLNTNFDIRQEVGRAARLYALEHFNLESHIKLLKKHLRDVSNKK